MNYRINNELTNIYIEIAIKYVYMFIVIQLYTYINVLAGQITRRVAPSVAASTGCSIIIIILFFLMNIVH